MQPPTLSQKNPQGKKEERDERKVQAPFLFSTISRFIFILFLNQGFNNQPYVLTNIQLVSVINLKF